MIISTMGNHEFYGSFIDYAYPSYEKKINENYFHVNNKSIIYKEVKFIVSVLWSEVPFYRVNEVENGINDYYYVYNKRNDGEKGIIRVEETNTFHKISVDYIKKELSEPFDGKIVLLTHHLPSYQCISEEHRHSSLNAAFASNLHEIIEGNPQIAYWICGHSHDKNVTKIGDTIVIRNPLGYVDHDEQQDFERDFFVEI